jgi:poly-gamma-glutamate capsule biosynthesis protein CapA/YwtB (metallophosphatase superfamily)
MNSLEKIFLAIFLTITLIVLRNLSDSLSFLDSNLASLSEISKKSFVTKPEKIKLVFVGDIMLDRGVAFKVFKKGGGDWRFPFLKISDYLKNADLVFGNLEGPLSDRGRKIGSLYSFRMKPEAVVGLQFSNFKIVSLANNHSFDYGAEALSQTFEILEKAGIEYVGAGRDFEEAFLPKVIKTKNKKFCFLAFTNLGGKFWRPKEAKPGLAYIEKPEEIEPFLKEAKKSCDFVIVSLHAGVEYSKEPDDFQLNFAKKAFEAGANLVIGHHPHVLQKLFRYQEGYFVSSLGNFIFDQSFSKDTMEGGILEVETQGNKISRVSLKRIRLNEDFQPELLED